MTGAAAFRPSAESGYAGPSSVDEKPWNAAADPNANAVAIAIEAKATRGRRAADGIGDLLTRLRAVTSGGTTVRSLQWFRQRSRRFRWRRSGGVTQTPSRHGIPWGNMAPAYAMTET